MGDRKSSPYDPLTESEDIGSDLRRKTAPAPAPTPEAVEARIHVIRGVRVMFDADLALLYGVTTSALNQAVDRNRARFPDDFAFRITTTEHETLKSQIVISNRGSGGRRRSLPRAFTEEGVAMLSSVLHSARAVAVNVLIMRAFVRVRRTQGEYAELRQRLEELEKRRSGRYSTRSRTRRRLRADLLASGRRRRAKKPASTTPSL